MKCPICGSELKDIENRGEMDIWYYVCEKDSFHKFWCGMSSKYLFFHPKSKFSSFLTYELEDDGTYKMIDNTQHSLIAIKILYNEIEELVKMLTENRNKIKELKECVCDMKDIIEKS